MDSTRFSSASVIFGTLLLLQVVYEGCSARKMGKSCDHGGMIQETGLRRRHSPPPSSSYMDPQLNVFFTPNDLKIGKRLPVFFDINDPSTYPHLLSREEADSIPFSSADLPYLLNFFSFSAASPQATAMAETLRHCEFRPMEGETKFCATSLESMLDSTRETFGSSGSKFRVLATKFVTKPSVSLQNYTIAAAPREIPAGKMVGCHTLPYPYAVFYCHSQQEGQNKVFRISLVGDNGEDRVEAVGVCHMDTAKWNRNHVSFRVLGIDPGTSPVCHFFPVDNLVWVPLP